MGGQSLLTAGVCWCGVVWGVGCEGAQSYSPLRSLADPSKASSAIAQKLLLGWTLLGYRPLVLVCAAALVGRRVPLEAAPARPLASSPAAFPRVEACAPRAAVALARSCGLCALVVPAASTLALHGERGAGAC